VPTFCSSSRPAGPEQNTTSCGCSNVDYVSKSYNKDLGVFVFLFDMLAFSTENDEAAGSRKDHKSRADDSEHNVFNFFLQQLADQLSRNKVKFKNLGSTNHFHQVSSPFLQFLFDTLSRDKKITRVSVVSYQFARKRFGYVDSEVSFLRHLVRQRFNFRFQASQERE
jgi:hypothetical protein